MLQNYLFNVPTWDTSSSLFRAIVSSCVLVERAGGRLDSQIEDLCRGLEIIGVCPYGTVMIALYETQGFLSERTVWLVL